MIAIMTSKDGFEVLVYPHHTYRNTTKQTTKQTPLVFIASQIVRIFGKFPALRRIIMSLTACTTPMIGAFSILVIFQCLCKWILHVPLHGACYSSNFWIEALLRGISMWRRERCVDKRQGRKCDTGLVVMKTRKLAWLVQIQEGGKEWVGKVNVERWS